MRRGPGTCRFRTRATCVVVWLVLAAALTDCGFGTERGLDEASAAALTGGSPSRGAVAIRSYGCGSCHTIAGVAGANSLVGPPLSGIGQRAYIAGVLPNTPANLVRWIQDPRGVDSKTAMPDLGVTEADARDIASYLYTLE